MVFPAIQYPPTWDKTITVLNRRAGLDSPGGLDDWKRTVLIGCFWITQNAQGQSGTEINLSGSCLVRIPRSVEYRPYQEWKKDMEGVTFSPGDYIIQGEVSEPVSAETVQQVLRMHLFQSFQVRKFKDNTAGPLPHYRLEGV